MAMTDTPQPSIGGVTSTTWKGAYVLSAKSLPYMHVRPGGDIPGMANGVRVRVVSGGDINLVNHASQSVDFDTADFDTDGFWDDGTPDTITIPPGMAGIYIVGIQGWFNLEGGQDAWSRLWVEDAIGDIWVEASVSTEEGTFQHNANGTTLMQFEDGDTIKMFARHDGDNDGTLFVDRPYSPVLYLIKYGS